MIYEFDNWRIDTARREAFRAGAAVALPRRVFDLVVYLLQQRERAVGRDELVAAVWGRVDVADVQVSQLIARARRLLGDDAQTQATIRTVSGFGYRWVMPLRSAGGEAAVDPVAVDTADAPEPIPPPLASGAAPADPPMPPVVAAVDARPDPAVTRPPAALSTPAATPTSTAAPARTALRRRLGLG
uniref:winged helix-turn-helix domain-containing protein n=1 Tax=Tahibacter caeni TaxID=1453545 RepID=UPI0021475B12